MHHALLGDGDRSMTRCHKIPLHTTAVRRAGTSRHTVACRAAPPPLARAAGRAPPDTAPLERPAGAAAAVPCPAERLARGPVAPPRAGLSAARFLLALAAPPPTPAAALAPRSAPLFSERAP
eukprot:scaffold3380_cov118-Isochrysis_galbana.AAC.7